MSKPSKVGKPEAFILEYEKEESLWNVRGASYKYRDVKQAAPSRIGELSMSISSLLPRFYTFFSPFSFLLLCLLFLYCAE